MLVKVSFCNKYIIYNILVENRQVKNIALQYKHDSIVANGNNDSVLE